MNLERRSDHEQQLRAPSELEGAFACGRRQELAEEHHIGLENLAAGRTGWRVRLREQPEHPLEPAALAAGEAAGGSDRAMHLDHLGAAARSCSRSMFCVTTA